MATKTFAHTDLPLCQSQALSWACKTYKYVFQFRNNDYKNGFENILFASNEVLHFNSQKDLKNFVPNENCCGCINYNLKNELENLKSLNHDSFDFPILSFIDADVRIAFSSTAATIHHASPLEVWENVSNTDLPDFELPDLSFSSKTDKQTYLETVSKLRQHIIEGDIYEICYCIEYLSNKLEIKHPEIIYDKLCLVNPKPFSSFVKLDEKYLIGASPERFLKKEGNKLISQPIKGTIKRSLDKEEDELLKDKLFNDAKERSENLMIVDLVRNDLSKISKPGTVNVDELFGIYSYPTVHQMISTISSQINKGTRFSDIIESSFPMGSMTGAPKIKAMELIDTYESFSRGLYSGSVGYFTADGFDFNVVIRSIQYANQQLGIHVGSAITYESSPEEEYEECLLKAKSLFDIFK